MKLIHLATHGIKGLPDRGFDFEQSATDDSFGVALVTGGPASGKSRLLEAIVAAKEDVSASTVQTSPEALVRDGKANATICATWLLSPTEQTSAEVDDAQVTTVSVFGDDKPVAHPEGISALFRAWKVEHFHAKRHLPAGAGAVPASVAEEARLRPRVDPDHYGVRAYLVEALLRDALALTARVRADGIALRADGTDTLAELRELVRPFLHGKVLDGIEPMGGDYRVRFRCRDEEILDLDELSAVEQQGVLFAVTFRRLGLDHALVLVDTPELHVHPSHQAEFFAQLVSLGTNNQTIAATSSTELLRGTMSAQVLSL